MSLSKHELSAALKRKYLDLNEKIVVLDYANEHPKMGCRKLAEHVSVGKTIISNILKDYKNLRRDYEFFKESCKKRRHGKYHVINKIVYKWYKCTNANAYPEGPLLREEAMEIAKRLEKEELTDFTASNGWLEKWKQIWAMTEKDCVEKPMRS